MEQSKPVLRAPVAKVEQLEDFDDEYVYDIGVAGGTPYFFANNILVHNSCYFSAIDTLKEGTEWLSDLFSALHEREVAIREDKLLETIYDRFDYTNRDHMVRFYDDVASFVNDSFPEFMHLTFGTTLHRGGYIKAGRELVASSGLFIKKKKYGLLKYEEDGKRLDVDGKPGKLKAMGLDLKRADTPKFMQEFLEKTLMDILCGAQVETIMAAIKQFRIDFKEFPSWQKGSPKKVSGLTAYSDKIDDANRQSIHIPMRGSLKVNMPGHVKASMNWNRLCDAHHDLYSQRITDGSRIVVCKLRPNPMRVDSIAYPIDETHLPKWFRDLPFDDEAMEETIIDNKITNLVGVLGWDLSASKTNIDDEFFS